MATPWSAARAPLTALRGHVLLARLCLPLHARLLERRGVFIPLTPLGFEGHPRGGTARCHPPWRTPPHRPAHDRIWVMTESPVCSSLLRNKMSRDHVNSESPVRLVSSLWGAGSRFPICGPISSGGSVLTVVGGGGAQGPNSRDKRRRFNTSLCHLTDNKQEKDKRCNTGKEKTKLSVVTDTVV